MATEMSDRRGVPHHGHHAVAVPDRTTSDDGSDTDTHSTSGQQHENRPRGGRWRRRRGGGRNVTNYLELNFRSVSAVVWQRTSVLVSLLLLQSLSQFILEMYEGLISHHVIIPLFLTMLVGAGGNAGNQATVRAITGLVSREFRQHDYVRLLLKEAVVGLVNATLLATIGFARVYYFYGSHDLFWSTVAITLSLFSIVLVSALLGSTLPFLLGGIGMNREHAAPIIQVVMDIVGVFLTCAICSELIPTSEHQSSVGPPRSDANV